ncbi:hypothetical protein D3C85_1575490 [compost metagenome]
MPVVRGHKILNHIGIAVNAVFLDQHAQGSGAQQQNIGGAFLQFQSAADAVLGGFAQVADMLEQIQFAAGPQVLESGVAEKNARQTRHIQYRRLDLIGGAMGKSHYSSLLWLMDVFT